MLSKSGKSEKLIYCGNLDGTCTVVDTADFNLEESPVETYPHLVSELAGHPSFIKVLSIEDSLKEKHDILFTAKTALQSIDECKSQRKGECKTAGFEALNNQLEFEILRSTEISTGTKHKLADMCLPQDFDVAVGNERKGMKETKDGYMRYIDVFTAHDRYAKVDWLYYVYEYFPVANDKESFFHIGSQGQDTSFISLRCNLDLFCEKLNQTNFDDYPKNNFRLGRVCSADLYFANVAEIPLSCGDDDKVRVLIDFSGTSGLILMIII